MQGGQGHRWQNYRKGSEGGENFFYIKLKKQILNLNGKLNEYFN